MASVEDGRIRASDRDRERTVAGLKEHCAEGRLEMEELEERVARAYAATTLWDLAVLTADLPGRLPSPPPQVEQRAPARSLPRAPGILSFTEIVDVELSGDEAMRQAMAVIAPRLANYGYEVVHHSEHSLDFEAELRPGWTIVVAVLVFPLGLIALAYKRRLRIRIGFDSLRPDRTRIMVSGSASLPVRRAFAELSD